MGGNNDQTINSRRPLGAPSQSPLGPAMRWRSRGADFFNGKTVNYIVATDPGGGYDTNGRLVAEFMQKHLPGSTFVVQNMPGAGHLIGTNYIYASEPDGLTIGTFNTGLIYGQLAGDPGIKFDLAKMSWIGKVSSDPRVIVVSKESGIDSFEQLKNLKEPIKFAAAGVGSASTIETTMLVKSLGLPIQIITGYNGNDDQLAMRRGEVQGIVGFALDLPAVRRRGQWQVHRPDRRLADRRAAACPHGYERGGQEGHRAGRIAEQHLAPDRRPARHSGGSPEGAARRLCGGDVRSGISRQGQVAGPAGRSAGRRAGGRCGGDGDGADAGNGRLPQGHR